MSYYPEFSHLVEEALRRLDHPPSWLAKRLGVNASTVSRWLNQGRRPRDSETVVRVADVLGLGVERQTLLTATGFGYFAGSPSEPDFLQPSHNLPAELTPFVGRDAQLSHIGKRLADPACRLLTVVGPGGIGKTRLAIRGAQEYGRRFAGGVYFVDLSSVQTPELLSTAILRSLNASVSGAVDATKRLCEFFHGPRNSSPAGQFRASDVRSGFIDRIVVCRTRDQAVGDITRTTEPG